MAFKARLARVRVSRAIVRIKQNYSAVNNAVRVIFEVAVSQVLGVRVVMPTLGHVGVFGRILSIGNRNDSSLR